MQKNTPSRAELSTTDAVYVGLDVHKRTIFLAARFGGTGLLEKVFDTQDLSKLNKALKALAKHGVVRKFHRFSVALAQPM